MTAIPHGPNGQPVTPIIPPRPTLFDGTTLWLFDDEVEFSRWWNAMYPPTPAPPEDLTEQPAEQ
jgi:hypothetical protein